MNKQADAVDDASLLSDAEKEELMNSLEDAAASLQNKSDELDQGVSKLRTKVES